MTDISRQPMNLNAFIVDFVMKFREDGGMNMDGADIQDMLAKYGIVIKRPATAEDCRQDWALEYDLEPGDPVYVDSPELAALRSQMQEDQ